MASKPPTGLSSCQSAPDAGEGDLPMQKVFAGGDLLWRAEFHNSSECGPEGALADGVGRHRRFQGHGPSSSKRRASVLARANDADGAAASKTVRCLLFEAGG